MQFGRVKGFFADTEKEGQKVIVGGMPTDGKGGKGYFITPAIIDHPAEESRLVTEEPFGRTSSSSLGWSLGLKYEL